MEYTVHEVAELCGISVRTLHHYDAIGLLHPARVTDAGYRLYDEASLNRLEQILFYRELAFPLHSIAAILDSPRFDREQALAGQKELLTLRREQLDRLIRLIEEHQKGGTPIPMNAFDHRDYEARREEYAKEAKARFGDTDAYRESEEKAAHYTDADRAAIDAEYAAIWQEFASARAQGLPPGQAGALVERWRQHISRYYYTCTPQILACLGQMYVSDERFTREIDSRFGEGTAAYASAAIAAYTA